MNLGHVTIKKQNRSKRKSRNLIDKIIIKRIEENNGTKRYNETKREPNPSKKITKIQLR